MGHEGDEASRLIAACCGELSHRKERLVGNCLCPFEALLKFVEIEDAVAICVTGAEHVNEVHAIETQPELEPSDIHELMEVECAVAVNVTLASGVDDLRRGESTLQDRLAEVSDALLHTAIGDGRLELEAVKVHHRVLESRFLVRGMTQEFQNLEIDFLKKI